jgi:soluble lytic murein transglycosylase-like protein
MQRCVRWQSVRVLLLALLAWPLAAADQPASAAPAAASVAVAAPAPVKSGSATMQDSLALQRKSIEAQRQAIRKQAAVPQGQTTDSFFTAPWIPERVAPPAPLSAALAPGTDCDPMPDPQLSALIEAAATRESVKPALVRAVIRQESGFRPCAVSPKGAQGLMQLMPATAERFKVENPFDPAQNVDAGTKFLKELLTRYSGDVKLALGAYNAGAARVDGSGAVPDIAETKDYVSNIINDLGAEESSGNTTPAPAGTT